MRKLRSRLARARQTSRFLGWVAEPLEIRTLLAGASGVTVDLVTGQNVAIYRDGFDLVVQKEATPSCFDRMPAA